jgi:hypothetical protein
MNNMIHLHPTIRSPEQRHLEQRLIARLNDLRFKTWHRHAANPKAQSRDKDDPFGGLVLSKRGQHELVVIDLDQHHEQQDANWALDQIREHAPEAFAKCVCKRSTNGKGYHIFGLSPISLVNNQRIYIKGHHVGEIFSIGAHIPLSIGDEWIDLDSDECDPVERLIAGLLAIHPLSRQEYDMLFSVVQYTQKAGDRRPATWTERYREILPVIRGYATIDTTRLRDTNGMPKVFQGNTRGKHIAQQSWRDIRQARRGERSNLYSRYIQSLMLHANQTFGESIEGKCRTVAALAIEDCAERDEPGYDVEKDTAALIAKTLHGDPYRHEEGRFLTPYWAQEYRPRKRSASQSPRAQNHTIERLKQLLWRYSDGHSVTYIHGKPLTVPLLAEKLKVSDRQIQKCLKKLEDQKEIVRIPHRGRGGYLEIRIGPNYGTTHEQR